ncbi:Oligopeptide transporter 3 [Lathyrus oleraceus]|uniref:Oligopeptide transporter 3 n=1 Tax=Pisum sativum TaxID=3888 RepID=A0A9D5BAK8_PEA|nr:Oligopeptide transporter 3 [Pisum sativum]
MQIAVLPIGKFMAATLPTKEYSFVGWRFTLNPGPFNMEEHVIIAIFANCGVSSSGGGGDVYSIGAITIMKAYYRESLSFLLALLIVISAQLIGFGWAGILRRYLVNPIEMWWPANLAQVWPNNVTAHQVGSGYRGLGVGAFTFDWAGISAYRGSPLVAPWTSIVNMGVGFIMFVYIILPICYWKFNTFDARKFPIFSNQLFTHDGQKYDTTKILNEEYDLNIDAYNKYNKLYLSPLYALSIGAGFARFTSTLTHVALFKGRKILRQSRTAMSNVKLDVHGRLMKAYNTVPEWWFLIVLFGSMALSIIMSLVWKVDVQLPWWGMLLAFALASVVTLPIGVIQATTNQQLGYDIIAQFMIGSVLPGTPIANLLFKIYGRITTAHALSFLSDIKLGHYMKIPPRCMYIAQLVGTLVAEVMNVSVAWWMLDSIKDICMDDNAHRDSPWTCPKYRVTFDASVIWGLIGPRRLFGPGGLYRNLVWLFLIGAVLPVPVWVFSKIYPDKKWIAMINVPIIFNGFAGMPPATPTNIATWLLTGMFFNFFVFRFHKRHSLRWWGTELDHCPLATCPTAPGIVVDGCPVF